MLVLRSSAASPFGRKVKIAASVLGLRDRISVVAADTLDAADPLRTQNPLGKIPALILENNEVLFDSRVIVEYLDHLAGGEKIIPPAPERFGVLKLQALADGVADATLLRVYEGRWRQPEKQEPAWIDHQSGKITRGLDWLEQAPLPEIGPLPHIGAIALACTLGYLDLRVPDWRPGHPGLAAWVDRFAAEIPAFDQTRPPA